MAIIPDVIPQDVIESVWGNAIRDTGITRFSSNSERNNTIPNPQDGRTCFVEDINQLYVGVAGTWRAVLHDGARGAGQVGSVTILSLPVTAPQGGRITYAGSPGWVTESYNGQFLIYTGSRAAAQVAISTSQITLRKNTAISGSLEVAQRLDADGGIRVDGGVLDVNVNTQAGRIDATTVFAGTFTAGGTALNDRVLSSGSSLAVRVTGAQYFTVESGTTDLMRLRLSGGLTALEIPAGLPELTGGQLLMITDNSDQIGRATGFPVGALMQLESDVQALKLRAGIP